ncbi:D-arabinono-1,4-lactone oxidase [Sodalis sp. RH22]|uniref:D-arabinono-1,4-lactone oxidase n=1 Tax=unclassified Sodalis (in: enterobacteria) TaxID=2636512 RepID=UPI0039B67342
MLDYAEEQFPPRHTQPVASDRQVWNWAQNATLGPRANVRRPGSEAELQTLVADARGKIRIMGSRLSTGSLLRADGPQDILLDAGQMQGLIHSTADTVTFAAATTLQQVYQTLTAMGRMLPSSPGVIALQTLAGAMATGTHGQGLGQSSIADEALHIRMVLADGSIAGFDRDHPYFGAAQLALGALGVVTEVTLRTIPATLFTCFKSACGAGELESLLYDWNEGYPLSKAWWFPEEDKVHVWSAREANDAEGKRYRENGCRTLSLSAGDQSMNATVERTLGHMRTDTKIRGRDGTPFKTVARFKDFSDITGDVYQLFCRGIATPQINIEIGIPFRRAGEVIQKIKRWYRQTHPHMHYPVILRCTGPSSAWLSPAHGEATCFFGFVVYYAEDGTLSRDGVHFLNEVEKLLANEGGRPHWGKYYHPALYQWRERYPRWEQFRQVKAALDPHGKFTNALIADLFTS